MRPRWAEAPGRPDQVVCAEPVAGTDAAEGGTASDRALGRVGGPYGAFVLFLYFHVVDVVVHHVVV